MARPSCSVLLLLGVVSELAAAEAAWAQGPDPKAPVEATPPSDAPSAATDPTDPPSDGPTPATGDDTPTGSDAKPARADPASENVEAASIDAASARAAVATAPVSGAAGPRADPQSENAAASVSGTPAAGSDDAQPKSFPSLTWLSPPRAISRTWSASRDTPVMDLIMLPRPVAKVGGDLALMTLQWPAWTLRGGFAAFFELEGDAETDGVTDYGLPTGSGKLLWRGSAAFFASMAFDALGRRLCAGCAVEATLQFRHESQHYTGGNSGGGDEDVSDQPYVGNDLILDLASSQQVGDFYFAQRLIGMWFVPEHSSYQGGAGVDLHMRWTRWQLAHPLLSLYGEYLVGDETHGRHYPNAYRARALVGLGLPSDFGDIIAYGFGDVGHRYGVRILTEEATLGVGVRLAVGARASTPPDAGASPSGGHE